MPILRMSGSVKVKASAGAATIGPEDTRQVAVDNSVIASMKAAVGSNKNKGAADVVR